MESKEQKAGTVKEAPATQIAKKTASLRIGVDLDGTICGIREDPLTYADVEPLPGAVQRLRQLKAKGHTIVIMTARHMKTCGGNPSLVVARVAQMTLEWLARHQIPYDEIHFGKPNTDIYIDDRCVRFESWHDITEERLQSLAKSK